MRKLRNLPTVWQYVVVFVGLIVCYLLFALAANLIPNKPIQKHVVKTVENGDLAADFGFMIVCRPEYYMDNFTDALILNQAYCGGSDDLLTSMLLATRRSDYESQCSTLHKFAQGNEPEQVYHYGRYWHGSTFLMRVLLLLGSYVSIRQLLYLISSMLLLWLMVVMARKIGLWAAALYLFSLLMVNVFMMQFSIQFVPVLLIALGASLWVLYRVKRPSQLFMLMFVVGSLTTFFDLLTCPMLTWGLPMCTYILLNAHQQIEQSFGKGLGHWTLASALWAVGYGVTWVSKWVIATLLTGENVIRDGLSQFAVRAGESDEITRMGAVLRNFDLIHWQPAVPLFLLLLILVLLRFDRRGWKSSLLCLLTVLPPCLWYMVTSNHAYLHFWFTYRSLAVVLAALFFALALLVDWSRLRKKWPKSETLQHSQTPTDTL